MLTYPCGHPRTDENTQSVGIANGVRCRTCRRKTARESARRNPKPSNYNPDEARAYRLPSMLVSARRKVASLEDEARRRGMLELLENRNA